MQTKMTVVGMLAGTLIASAVYAQAPTSAQVWDVRWSVDSSGPFAEGPGATQVGITLMARVNILSNTTTAGTTNFGVSRVGGAGSATSGFRAVFTDPEASALSLNQGRVAQGATIDVDGRVRTDTQGAGLRGMLAPFRGVFAPQVGPLFLGSNTDPGNGLASNPSLGPAVLYNAFGNRLLNFGSEGTGPLGADGEFAPLYRLYYFPSSALGMNFARTVSVNVTGMTARYLHDVSITFGQIGPQATIPDHAFAFQVPGPGVAGFLWLGGGLVLQRRRR